MTPVRILAVPVVAVCVLAAGCGSGSPDGSSGASATSSAQGGALAFARCMRAHGLPAWPDPDSHGGFDKSKLRRLGLSVSRVRAIEDGACKDLLPSSAPGPAITPAQRTDYIEAAACMRRHGFPSFPDPTFPEDRVRTDIPASIDQDSPRFRNAAATCTRLIPAGLPYSGSSRSSG